MGGATRFGQFASGAFTVQGMVPTGIAASGSFEVTGANSQGTVGTGTFTSVGVYSPAVSSSFQFTAGERTVLGSNSTASFEVSGAYLLVRQRQALLLYLIQDSTSQQQTQLLF